ncbi:MFS transporter [Granulosicoccus sp. 3-233]|uniref:MFS transporter n=1 Tax=Granulosicoccus sp. 3-233 TaxID=3417969 RepID=UPI003D338AA1
MPVRQTSEVEFIALFGFLTSLTALSIDAIIAGMPIIARELSNGADSDVHLIISALVLGMAVGEPVFGPLSDARGRKFAILLGIAIFVSGAVLAVTAQDLKTLLLARFIQGVGVAGPKIGSRAAIRDRYEGASMARAMSIILTVLIMVPMLAPALGELVMLLGSWRTIFIAYCVLATVGALWLCLRQPEPLPLQHRRPFLWGQTLATALRICANPRVMPPTIAAGLMFGCLTSYYGIAASIFHDIYAVGSYFTTLFALLALGMGIATLTNSRLVMRLGMYRLSKLALIGMVASGALLLGFSTALGGAPSLMVFMLLFSGSLFAIGILFGNLGAMAMEPLGAVAGVGASVIASVSSAVAVVVSMTSGHFYDQTLIPLSICLCSCAIASLALVHKAECSELVPVQAPLHQTG